MPPYARNVNTVFQDYALFPHMTVAQNIEYGLRVRKVPKAERREKAARALEMVRLPGLGGRKPAQLSGGQRQRVALARAIVNEPQVLLLDEPLGALDLKLRQEMQLELQRVQREVGITFVYVTHDQEEALTMSDRIAVLTGGRIEQIGGPVEVYERPRTPFVAGFIGVSNLIERDGHTITVRPEKITLLEEGAPDPAGVHVEPGLRQGRHLRRRAHPLHRRPGRRRRAGGQPAEHRGAGRLRRSAGRPGAARLALRAGIHYPFRGGLMKRTSGRRSARPIRRPMTMAIGLARAVRAGRVQQRRQPALASAAPRTNGATQNGGGAVPGQTVPTANLPVLQKVGKGEGQLNLIAWEGYLDPKWVKPFEQQTGCQVNAKYAGSSDEMVALMKNGGGGQYDMVSSSGDADLRILYAGDAHPVNIKLIPSWKDFFPAFQSPAFNTINGVHYGVSLQWGPNVLMYNTKDFTSAPTLVGRHLQLQVQGPGHGA